MSRILFAGLALALLAPAAAAQTAASQDTASLPPQEIGVIPVGATRNGLLEIGDYTMGDATWADVWYVNVMAGQRLTIDLRSRQFDPYMQLLDPWGGKYPTWTQWSDLGTSLAGQTALLDDDEQVARTAEVYDPATNLWTALSSATMRQQFYPPVFPSVLWLSG